MKFNFFDEFICKKFFQPDELEVSKLFNIVNDKNYTHFIRKFNGGSILNNSLNMYGVLPHEFETEIFYNNFLFKKYYGELFSDFFVIGEDIFGNQFGFARDKSLAFLNIETAGIENVFENFNHFVNELSNDIGYYTGFSIAEKWSVNNGTILPRYRLSPIKPFIIGGDYGIKNFHLLEKESLFAYTSFIAKQIKDLPDGTSLVLNVK